MHKPGLYTYDKGKQTKLDKTYATKRGNRESWIDEYNYTIIKA